MRKKAYSKKDKTIKKKKRIKILHILTSIVENRTFSYFLVLFKQKIFTLKNE